MWVAGCSEDLAWWYEVCGVRSEEEGGGNRAVAADVLGRESNRAGAVFALGARLCLQKNEDEGKNRSSPCAHLSFIDIFNLSSHPSIVHILSIIPSVFRSSFILQVVLYHLYVFCA
jgi:hypothetical protein